MDVSDPLTTAFLLVETTRRGEPVWAVKWRGAGGSRAKRRLGAVAWVERDGVGGWRPREGRPRGGQLTERQARRLMATVVRTAEDEAAVARARAAGERAAAVRAAGPTFRMLAHAWLEHLAAVEDVKPSTLRNHRAMLVEPGAPYRRGQGRALGRIMDKLGDKPPVEITTTDVTELLDAIAANGVSRRTVNRHREVIVAIFNYALRPERRERWGLSENPAAATPKRREDGPGRLEVFTVEQVEALARTRSTGGDGVARREDVETASPLRWSCMEACPSVPAPGRSSAAGAF